MTETGGHPLCVLEWGRSGAKRAADRGDIVVVVDTLSFSTSVIAAVHNEAIIYPCPPGMDAARLAAEFDAELAVKRREVPAKGRFSLSPLTYGRIEPGTKVVLPSPNGGACCLLARQAPNVFVGAPVNARAVAEATTAAKPKTGAGVSIIACGETLPEPTEESTFRFAVEDYLGAGAIISYLSCNKSAEARLCQAAFERSRDTLVEIIRESESGQELIEMGYPGDVEFAAQLNCFDTVPVLRSDALVKLI